MRVLLVVLFLVADALALHAQEAELAPIVVTGTFELRQPPPLSETFTFHLEKQIEARKAAEEAAALSPLLSARFWSYIPMRLESASLDSSQFFTPSYLTIDYRNSERALEQSRKQSLFDTK